MRELCTMKTSHLQCVRKVTLTQSEDSKNAVLHKTLMTDLVLQEPVSQIVTYIDIRQDTGYMLCLPIRQ